MWRNHVNGKFRLGSSLKLSLFQVRIVDYFEVLVGFRVLRHRPSTSLRPICFFSDGHLNNIPRFFRTPVSLPLSLFILSPSILQKVAARGATWLNFSTEQQQHGENRVKSWMQADCFSIKAGVLYGGTYLLIYLSYFWVKTGKYWFMWKSFNDGSPRTVVRVPKLGHKVLELQHRWSHPISSRVIICLVAWKGSEQQRIPEGRERQWPGEILGDLQPTCVTLFSGNACKAVKVV